MNIHEITGKYCGIPRNSTDANSMAFILRSSVELKSDPSFISCTINNVIQLIVIRNNY
jgi:hypothetical protein